LYITEARDLSTVMTTMSSSFSLQATPKQWKTQLRKWGFFKNLPSTVTLRIHQTRRDRGATFSSAGHFLDGQRLPPETVARASCRRDRRPKEAKVAEATKPGRSLVYLGYAEAALRAIRAYTDASSSTWVWDPRGQLYLSAKGGTAGRLRLSQFHDSLLFTTTVLSRSCDDVSCKWLSNITLASLPTIIQDEDPLLIGELLGILAQLQTQPALQSYFIRILVNATVRFLGPGHSLAQLFRTLEASEASTRAEFLCCILKAQVSELADSLAAERRPMTMAIINIHMNETNRLVDPKCAELPDIKGISTLAARAQRTAVSRTGLHLQVCAARRFLCLGQVGETRAIIDGVLGRESCRNVIAEDPQLAYGFFLLLGHLRWKEGRREEAERHIREALENAYIGGNWGLFLEGLAQLEIFLRSVGHDTEAEVVWKCLIDALVGNQAEADALI
jgi:hypothetical protein